MLLSILSIPYDSSIDTYRYRKLRYFCRAWSRTVQDWTRLNVKTPTAKADPSSFQTSPLPTPGVKVLNGRTRYRSWVQVLDLCLLSLLVVGFSDLARLGRETQLIYSRLHAIECKLIEPHWLSQGRQILMNLLNKVQKRKVNYGSNTRIMTTPEDSEKRNNILFHSGIYRGSKLALSINPTPNKSPVIAKVTYPQS
jgi:hypothetical protein